MLQSGCNLISGGVPFRFSPEPLPVPVNPSVATNSYLADLAYNTTNISGSSTAVHDYPDPDGVVRKGDSNPSTTEISGDSHQADSPFGYGYNSAYTNATPVLLNRPFNSVAEMGYAYRDDPWRSVNFSSADSADGGLLDLFCLTPNNNTTRAGVIDPNGASQQVLAALLMNNYLDPATPTAKTITYTQATNIAAAIRNVLGPPDNPTFVMRNASDIPTLTSMVATNSLLTATNSTTFEYKYSREALARSLADIANTRTWNLMIDVIAQSGRYTAGSQTLNDFTVEGERRYWMHVAIDRFTGKIIASQIEPVSE
jgi:hypothetical protein